MRKREEFFDIAQPVWAKRRSHEMNLTLGFYGAFEYTGHSPVLYVTGSSVYRVFLNGEFIWHGPARAAHGYSRVDEVVLPKKYLKNYNSVAIEVAGFCVGSFYLIDQPSFLQAEIRIGERILLYTGTESEKKQITENAKLFESFVLEDRLQKVQRYSYQRVFLEAYHISENYSDWRCKGVEKQQKVILEKINTYRLLERHVANCKYPLLKPEGICGRGKIKKKEENQWKDRSFLWIGSKYKGYFTEELDIFVSQKLDAIYVEKSLGETVEKQTKEGVFLSAGQYVMAVWEYNATGFLGAQIECSEDCILAYIFDEVLTSEGRLDYHRMGCVNAVWWELKKGKYNVETLQPYTLKYGSWIVIQGSAKIKDMWVREYTNPEIGKAEFLCDDVVVNRIFEAGCRTFAQNGVDIYTDCPSRERAGWLCDSFFMGRVESVLTGDTKVEDNFLENYLLAPQLPELPEGMLPMCYPADHTLGEYIPNWALWMVLELEEYHLRKPEEVITKKMFSKVKKLFRYLQGFENEEGLLENLEGWIFVEWSRANDLVEGVNYPSNMVYSAALKAAGRLYRISEWIQKGEDLAHKIQEQSFQYGFFKDQALRKNGKLVVGEESTEVCQYYAFVMGIAHKEDYPELFELLCKEFGPERIDSAAYPEIAPANAFIGNYLRIEMLSQYGLQNKILEETRDFFDYMVQRTGTLWENMGDYASCNHGFASHITEVCFRDFLGVHSVDIKNKKIELWVVDGKLESCEGRIPIGKEFLAVKIKREKERVIVEYFVPHGYQVVLRNKGHKPVVLIEKGK